LAEKGDGAPLEAAALEEALRGSEAGFREAMDNDFNTSGAIGGFFELAKEINTYIDRCQQARRPTDRALLAECRASMLERGAILGLLQSSPEARFRPEPLKINVFDAITVTDTARIEALIAERQRARERKDWAMADRIRDELAALHIQVEDGPQGTRWKFLRPLEA
jgi:cysteinyl-tRNA synthetase